MEPADAAIDDAARREVDEETGARLADGAQLIGLDVHGIPPKRGEPLHLHHDLLFLFRAVGEEVRVSDESHAIAWCGPAEFDRYQLPGNVRRAYARDAASLTARQRSSTMVAPQPPASAGASRNPETKGVRARTDADHLALHADAASMDNAQELETEAVGFLEVFFDDGLHVARGNAMQIEDVGDGNANGVGVHHE